MLTAVIQILVALNDIKWRQRRILLPRKMPARWCVLSKKIVWLISALFCFLGNEKHVVRRTQDKTHISMLFGCTSRWIDHVQQPTPPITTVQQTTELAHRPRVRQPAGSFVSRVIAKGQTGKSAAGREACTSSRIITAIAAAPRAFLRAAALPATAPCREKAMDKP